MKRRKKVGIMLCHIHNIGGIMTHAVHLKNGFIDNNIDCDIIYSSSSGKGGSNIPEVNVQVGYDDKSYKNMQRVLQKYDAIFYEIIPHETKRFKDNKWQRWFYADTKHIAIYHDTLGNKAKWIADVGKQIWAHVGVQEKTEYSFKALDYDDYLIIRHPMNIDIPFSIKDTQKIAIAPHHWKTWKRMQEVIMATMYQKYPTITYGYGIELRKMMSDDPKHKKKHDVWLQVQKVGNHKYGGLVSRDELNNAYMRSRVIVDISRGEMGYKTGLPNINYSTLEGILFGCIPVVSYHESQFPGFPKENVYVADEFNLLHSLANCVDRAIDEYPNKIELLKKNRKFVIDNFDQKKIAEQFLNILDNPQRKIMKSKKQQYGFF